MHISLCSRRGSRTPLLLLLFVTVLATGAPTPDWKAQADAYLQKKVGDHKFMGAALIARGGQILFERAYGRADAEWEDPNTTDTIFRLGSLSKQFTAAAVMQLAQQGKLKLDDLIGRYEPNVPEAWKGITLHQLLTHTSGIPNYTSQAGFWATITRPYTPQELVNVVREKPLDFAPGSRWAYSNTNYILLGIVIEKVSGRKYADYMHEEIFRPLQMQNSGYDSPTPILRYRAHGYVPSGNTIANAPYIDMTVPYSAGALYSTVEDLLKWDQALSGEAFLKREWRDKMFTGYAPTTVGGSYGYGWFVTKQSGRTEYGHEGGIPGFNTMMARYPEDQTCVIVLSNLATPEIGKIAADLASLVFSDPVSTSH